MLTVGVGSYGITCTACFGLATMLSIGWITRHWTIVGAVTALFFWATLGLYSALGIGEANSIYVVSDVLRSAAFLLLLNHALQRLNGGATNARSKHTAYLILLLSSVLALSLVALSWAHHPDANFWRLIGHVGLSVAGLFFIESLLKAGQRDRFRSTKHLLLGVGAICSFDLFYYMAGLLRADDTWRAGQPIIAILAMPLILVSARRLQDVKINHIASKTLVVGTTALIASGTYILSIAGAAYLIRGLDWRWDPILQLISLFGAALVLLAVLSSRSWRQDGPQFIGSFPFAGDNHRAWRQVVESMAATQPHERLEDPSLGQRALKATAELMKADGGALFTRRSNGHLYFKTSWNIALEDRAPSCPPASLLKTLSSSTPTLMVDEALRKTSDKNDQAKIEEWLSAFRNPWFVMALMSRNEIVGLALITRPHVRRRLTWEDCDLLQILAHQLGSQLAMEQLARHVAESEHSERMSRQASFVTSDLKNLISELSLVLQQAKDHAHSPVFISDTVLTIGDVVERMKRLREVVLEEAGYRPTQAVNLRTMIDKLNTAGRVDRLASSTEPVVVEAELETLQALFDHLIDNAWAAVEANKVNDVEATSRNPKAHLIVDDLRTKAPGVSLTLRKDPDNAIVDIADTGIGMTGAFIETELFEPFRSTKQAGLGMHQCRIAVEHWGGQLKVKSKLGEGTTVSVILPLSKTQKIDTELLNAATNIEPAKAHAA